VVSLFFFFFLVGKGREGEGRGMGLMRNRDFFDKLEGIEGEGPSRLCR
jgi:hypothetical protein